jgi:hypothetical protein
MDGHQRHGCHGRRSVYDNSRDKDEDNKDDHRYESMDKDDGDSKDHDRDDKANKYFESTKRRGDDKKGRDDYSNDDNDNSYGANDSASMNKGGRYGSDDASRDNLYSMPSRRPVTLPYPIRSSNVASAPNAFPFVNTDGVTEAQSNPVTSAKANSVPAPAPTPVPTMGKPY